MRLKLDENLPTDPAEILQRKHHDVETIVGEDLSGSPDATIASRCQSEDRTLITLDLGFGNIQRYRPRDYPGIVLRLRRQDRATVISAVQRFLDRIDAASVRRATFVVDDDRIRIRRE